MLYYIVLQIAYTISALNESGKQLIGERVLYNDKKGSGNYMKGEKTDRRIKYTKMVLKQSLINLLKVKSITKISVKEICEEADINRATFYSHYSDQYALLNSIEKELIDDINLYLSSCLFNDNESETLQVMCKLFEYIKDNSELCSCLLGENGNSDFQQDVMLIFQRQFTSEWTTKKTMKRMDAEYIFSYTAIGSIGLIQIWLRDGMKKSAREMAEFLVKLTNQGLNAFIT